MVSPLPCLTQLCIHLFLWLRYNFKSGAELHLDSRGVIQGHDELSLNICGVSLSFVVKMNLMGFIDIKTK